MINQVNKFVFNRTFYAIQQRHYCKRYEKVLYPLKDRTLIRVAGRQASLFLQGLMTNDMRHFEEGAKSIYAMFLNNKGRVLYDTLIHKLNDEYMLECDKSSVNPLIKHLKMFKLRRPVHIEDASKEYELWVLLSNHEFHDTLSDVSIDNVKVENINIYKDPRISELGHRVLIPCDALFDMKDIIGHETAIGGDEKHYKWLRYKLGVSEGTSDLPPGTCFPLEVNCDYLHGVSFHKGCYVGQELTARVHHTGVVRKRIMPLKFIEDVQNLSLDSKITSKTNSAANYGKLKGYVANYGLGLVRIKEAMEAKDLIVGEYPAHIIKPLWWPLEASKEKASTVIKED